MITKFTFVPSTNDFNSFYKFKDKLTRENFFIYLMSMSMIAFGVYETITTKQKGYIFSTFAFVVAIAVFWILQKVVLPKSKIKNISKIDSTFFSKYEYVITRVAVEINSVPQINEPIIKAIYPYSIMSGVFETEEYYYFLISSGETRILPKSAIPQNDKTAVNETLKKLANYSFIK